MSRIKRLVACCGVMFASLQVFAVNVRTTIPAIAHEADFQRLGTITLDIESDAFANASPVNPIYIRFRLLHSNGWSKTLVDLRPGASAYTNYTVPINLAIFPSGGQTIVNTNIPDTAIQLVRMIKGENEAWLRVTDSSSDWVVVSGGTAAPSMAEVVSVTIGVNAENSVRNGAHTSMGGNQFSDSSQLASTALFADYRNTPSFRDGDLESVDFISLDATSSGVETGDEPIPGANLSISFSDDLVIARGTSNFPCFDFHTAPESFNAPAHRIALTRLDLAELNIHRFDIPAIYLSNTSDFDWQVGTRIFIALPGFNTDAPFLGANFILPFDPDQYPVLLEESALTITTNVAADNPSWQVLPFYWEDVLAGYELRLNSGVFSYGSRLQVSGLRGFVDRFVVGDKLDLKAKAHYVNQQVTNGQILAIGPLPLKTLVLEAGSDTFFRKIIPYTANDRRDWRFNTHLANPFSEPVKYTALFYNRHGILLRLLGGKVLPANGKEVINIPESFGELAGDVLSWIEILSLKPLAVTGVIEDMDEEMLDLFPASDTLYKNLYGAHLPSQIQAWDTKAYLLSADLEADTTFYLKLAGSGETRVNNVFLPGSTFVLKDNNFTSGSMRSPWFEVETGSEKGTGLLLFSRKDEANQLVSILMNTESAKDWRYDHVGDHGRGWWNGLVILNASNEPASITIKGLDSRGGELVSRQFTVPAQAKMVDTLDLLLPYMGARPISRLLVTSNRAVVSFLLMGMEAQSVLTRVSGNTPAGMKFVLPYMPPRADTWVGLAVSNLSGIEIDLTVTPYTWNGTPGTPALIAVPTLDKVVFVMSDLFANPSQFSHAILETNGSVRVMGLTGNAAGSELATIDLDPIP